MNERSKFGMYRKRLQGICDENNLVYSFVRDRYPLSLVFKTTGSMSGQLSMLEDAEEKGFRSPDARLIMSYIDGDFSHRITGGTFDIGEALFNKLKNLFKNMCAYWLQFFHKEVIEGELLTAMPEISDDDDEDDNWEHPYEEQNIFSGDDGDGNGDGENGEAQGGDDPESGEPDSGDADGDGPGDDGYSYEAPTS